MQTTIIIDSILSHFCAKIKKLVIVRS